MKFKQEFTVAERVSVVWDFFQRAEAVAQCMPGIDNVQVLEPDLLSVRMTQKVGPISASFDTSVRIAERVAPSKIQFTLTGKAVRGAVGNFRATNTVTLHEQGDSTHVVVEGEAALAGALGSVGHRVIAKQAEKLTAEFAANLSRTLSGAGPVQEQKSPPAGLDGSAAAVPVVSNAYPMPLMQASDPWNKVAASFSVATFIVSLFVLYHVVS
ncbi:MAG: CoxG family protein [Alcaligenes sp.]